jgi:ankyrin repeat protein
MLNLSGNDPLALAVKKAIHTGDLPALKQWLNEHPELAQARIGDQCEARTLLHLATDWPGHFPNGAATVALLVEAGADVNARFTGAHAETPLHWAASSNDVAVLDALLDAGADIEATGAVIGGGTPLADARGFAQWEAAHRLVERGARTTLNDAATLGLMERLEAYFAAAAPPAPEEINRAFWGACHGGQSVAAAYLLARGADLNWLPPLEKLTPLDAAQRQQTDDLVAWLRIQGAQSAQEL